ncbi:MAG: hypothetical protein ACM3PW_14925, partial [Chlamydiota bacterium]
IATSVVAMGSYPCTLHQNWIGFRICGETIHYTNVPEGGKADADGGTGVVTAGILGFAEELRHLAKLIVS